MPSNLCNRELFFLVGRGIPDLLKLRVAVALHAVFKARHGWKSEDGPMDRQYAKELLKNYYFASDRFTDAHFPF